MLQMLQSDGDRWPDKDDEVEVNYDWDLGKAIEKDRPVDREIAKEAENEVSAQTTSDKNIKTGKKKQVSAPKTSSSDLMKFVGLGTELLAGVLVGTLLGWAFNKFTGYHGPWALIVGVLLGAAAGFLNLYRAVTEGEEQENSGSSK